MHTSSYVSIRQQTSAYVSIRQHTSAYVSSASTETVVPCHQQVQSHSRDWLHTSAYVSIRQHTSLLMHTSAYVSIRRFSRFSPTLGWLHLVQSQSHIGQLSVALAAPGASAVPDMWCRAEDDLLVQTIATTIRLNDYTPIFSGIRLHQTCR